MGVQIFFFSPPPMRVLLGESFVGYVLSSLFWRCFIARQKDKDRNPPFFPLFNHVPPPHASFALFAFVFEYIYYFCGPGSSVGIATELRAGRSGIESR